MYMVGADPSWQSEYLGFDRERDESYNNMLEAIGAAAKKEQERQLTQRQTHQAPVS